MSKKAKPKLAIGYRLQFEKTLMQFILLFPEGMFKLNDSAALILQRCTGTSTIQEIIAELTEQFPESNIEEDINQFLGVAYRKGWVQ